MSNFDPDKFMDLGTSEAGSTQFEPIPAGTYNAIIDSVQARSVTTKNGEGVVLDVTFLLQDGDLQKKLGREKLSVKDGIFLDMNGAALDMAKGKNIKLNKLRDAVGQNVAGKPWKFAMLQGAGPLKVQVIVDPAKDSDALYNRIRSYGKL